MEENSAPPPLNLAAEAAPPPPPLPRALPPPIIAPSPPPPPARTGRGWMICAFILMVLLGFSMLFNMGHYLRFVLGGGGSSFSSHSSGPRLDEVVTEDYGVANKIAVVDLHGIITSQTVGQDGFGMVDVVRAQFKKAEDDERVKAVILKVDSPGGEVLASDEIYRVISDFQKGADAKPVVASMGNLAASGGYYVSAPCRWIVANELTITGSIGVILHSYNYRGLMDKVGLKPEVYKSGRFKDMLSGEREPDQISDEERQMLQSLINQTYQKFKSVVAAGRGQAHAANKSSGHALSSDWESYADGRVLSGSDALKLGFVDSLGDFEDAVKKAKELAGISNANLIEYQQRYDLSDIFHLFGKSESRVVKVDLGFDAPRLQTGQLYYLSPTVLH